MTEADETFVNSALKELAQQLKEAPIQLSISVKRLASEPDLVRKVKGVLNKTNDQSCGFSYYVAKILGILSCHVGVGQPFTHMRLLVYCHKDSQVSKGALREKPSALWGATCSPLAAVYEPNNKFAIWHEALHLLGLDECYDENTLRRKCKCKTCVMQYEPPLGVDENWPSRLCDNLCGRQKRKLQNLANKVAKVEKGKRSS